MSLFKIDWTSQTQFSIAPLQAAPVPEPASGAMAAAGAVLLGALHRRRAVALKPTASI